MQDFPPTPWICCASLEHMSSFFQDHQNPFYGNWKLNTSAWKEVAVNLYWNVESIMIKYQCLIVDEEAQFPAMVQCQRIDMSGFYVLWRFMWIQTYQSSMKYWQVGIELTFVDLLEHFIMDSTVLCKLMTLALSCLLTLFGNWTHGSILGWFTNMRSVFLESGD